MIPTHNCAQYLGATLRSVLDQDPGPNLMQIEVVDDNSTQDDPAAVVRAVGQGRVGFFRQERNIGHVANFETCLNRTRGHLVHILHGDDRVRPGFYEKLGQAFELAPEIGAAFCRQIFIDASDQTLSLSPLEETTAGTLPNALLRLAQEQRIMTPSIVVKRKVYERLGAFDRRLTCSEDWEMWVRIAANYPVWYEPEPLAQYRIHEASSSARHQRTADDMAYTRAAIKIFQAYLPEDLQPTAERHARRVYAVAALVAAGHMLEKGDVFAFFAQLREALRFERSPGILMRVARMLVRSGIGRLRHG
ncbi:glycosyltransferase [Microvirga terrae]|uniref:Glycosyltransferase n=2 Tax=Microvirga terrae TaxID=2740529 RepID=A0ABY5RXP4_9HYPH|nr:glycosyltransferase [Microvirga terrae]UVF22036.1 glycosyltransferase [Microvirga terrae]